MVIYDTWFDVFVYNVREHFPHSHHAQVVEKLPTTASHGNNAAKGSTFGTFPPDLYQCQTLSTHVYVPTFSVPLPIQEKNEAQAKTKPSRHLP